MEVICSYHLGDTILSMQKATLIPGGAEAITYTTLGMFCHHCLHCNFVNAMAPLLR